MKVAVDIWQSIYKLLPLLWNYWKDPSVLVVSYSGIVTAPLERKCARFCETYGFDVVGNAYIPWSLRRVNRRPMTY